jgi:hypothetical protein
MARLLAKRRCTMAIAMCLTQVCHAGQGVPDLKINPFARPVDNQVNPADSAASGQAAQVPFVLRGTMVAGQQSLANISGVIVSLGEEINGFKLIAIHQREVVLLKNDERRILSVDDKNEGSDNEPSH